MTTLLKNLLILPLLFLSTIVFGQNRQKQAVQQYLNDNHAALNLSKKDVQSWVVTDNYMSKSGVRHYHIAQTVNGVKVQNGTANITLNANDSVLFIGSRLLPLDANKSIAASIGAKQAVVLAAQHSNMVGSAGGEIKVEKENHFKFKKGNLSQEDIDVELAFWHNGEELKLVWITTLYELTAEHWWQIFVDAETGAELNRLDWVVSCKLHHHVPSQTNIASGSVKQERPTALATPPPSTDQYNVFEFPIESPNHGSIGLVVGPFSSNASPFGWHDDNGVAGEEYTITRGNNVHAYEDANNTNAPGYSPDGGTALNFNFPLNINQAPVNYQDAAITNLFYANNKIHDILYEYGFDESSGNFQENNYGNGGAASDYVQAEAQDGGGTNNANFATPPDGFNPRMQMFLWTSNTGISNILTVNSPSAIAGTYFATEASFGPGVPASPLTGDLVFVDDAVGTADDGCEAAVNASALAGKIAVVYRGGCSFALKVENAQNAGAIAVVVINDVGGNPIIMGGVSNIVTIPSIMVSQADGAAIATEMALGTVNITLGNTAGNFDTDGSFDNGIVVHEYGHGVSNRLTGGPANSGCLSNDEQMGEGWSDILAVLLTMDMTVPNPVNRPIGTFAISEPTTGGGIRNAPYDTSFAVNNFTYGDVADAANISRPHGIGFVWATMLWDLNWALIDQYGFDANIETGTGGNNIALQLIIEGLKLQACSPGFVDGRDGILLADQVLYGGANQCLIWKAFARRGLGFSADQGSSNSRFDQVEAFDLPPSCAVATTAPNANFDANTYITCSGIVEFQDLSTDVPQNWLWDFGDGATDTVPNPSHTYTSPGIYNVKLVVSNTIGSDSLEQLAFIEVISLTAPTVTDGGGCLTDSILLSASGTNTIHWKDLAGNLLAVGDDFYTQPSANSSSYLAVNVEDFPNTNIGPVDNNFGQGGNHNTGFIGAINFEAEKELTIYSAWVDAGSAGTRTVTLWDAYNSGGTAIQVINVDIPFTGPGRVELGFEVPGPGQYSIGLNNADLYRNSAGANYPYTVPGLMTIVSSSATGSPADFYYYFYDLEVSEKTCESTPVQVEATVSASDFIWNNVGLTTNFVDSSPTGTSWLWNFGDGNTSILQDPSHTYSSYGTYNVSLQVDGGCTVNYEVNIDNNLGTLETEDGQFEMTLFPNPATSELNFTISKALEVDAMLQIYSADGKLVKETAVGSGETNLLISVADMSAQIYYVVLNYETGVEVKKLIVQ